MRCRAAHSAAFVIVLLLSLITRAEAAAPPKLTVEDAGAAFDEAHVEFRGVAAGVFAPRAWEEGALHLVPDIRSPLIEPREGKFRNIYAPSVVRHGDGWRIYYGGWDGAPSGNDRIYSVDADADFLQFTDRRTVIEHGAFQHVCNVNVIPVEDDGRRTFAMACTAYPTSNGTNKPVTFFSEDAAGAAWSAAAATAEHLITIAGYEKFADADINGMNVLLREEGKYRLFFNNFRDFGRTYRASGDDGRRFRFDGVAMERSRIVNDVKKLRHGDDAWYLMGLHANGPELYYAVSRDGMKFPEPRKLLTHQGEADRFIVAIGLVCDGDQEKPGRRMLGLLYGAGAAPSLDQNRIFASWLQKKLVFDRGDEANVRALGPDRQLIALAEKVVTRVTCLAEDGRTVMAASEPVELTPGRAYRLDLPAAAPAPRIP